MCRTTGYQLGRVDGSQWRSIETIYNGPAPALASHHRIMTVIPTINLREHSLEEQAKLMRHALSSVGFFAVEGTDLPVQLIREMFSTVSPAEASIRLHD